MSHIETYRGVKIVDKTALTYAANNLGLDVVEKSKFKMWGSEAGGAAFVLSISDKKREELGLRKTDKVYEIGVMLSEDGSYYIAMDAIDYRLNSIVGDPIQNKEETILAPKLLQEYRMCADLLTMNELGELLEERIDHPDGSVEIVIQVNPTRVLA